MKTLICVDMQNDFITGSLANPAAQAIVPIMVEYLKTFDGKVIFTRDTHYHNYMETQEGKNLPIMHCQYGSKGWEIQDDLFEAIRKRDIEWVVVDKNSFGDIYDLEDEIDAYEEDEVYLCGTCTDICVISVALNLKARFPEVKMYCIADLCAGLTPEKHAAALEIMKSCQIEVI